MNNDRPPIELIELIEGEHGKTSGREETRWPQTGILQEAAMSSLPGLSALDCQFSVRSRWKCKASCFDPLAKKPSPYVCALTEL
jgi:hypothetical protein